ncbi:MAG TPA: hypothetical protein VKU94_06520 [Geobacterales bacterium]|nr:hypothetical protein [Geobacterales bacterium]
MKRKFILLSIFLLFIILSINIKILNAQNDNFLDQFEKAYTALYNAELNGGNITELYYKLNQSLAIYEEAQQYKQRNSTLYNELIDNATKILNEVMSNVANVEAQGIATTNNRILDFSLEMVSLVIAGILVYIYMPRITLYIWLKIHSKWKVVKK